MNTPSGQVTLSDAVARNSVPRHVAIIMDGNNRWAKRHHMPGFAGHKSGVEAVRAVVEECANAGVEVLTLFAFSSENWQRPIDEVNALMDLFITALRREVVKLNEHGIRLVIIGDRYAFSPQLQQAMQDAEKKTAQNTKFLLQIAANYGGQWDIVQATRKLAKACANGELDSEKIDATIFASALSTVGVSDPDFCIRTGGECRISNFLLWQMAYTEFYFTDMYWPEFRQEAMQLALLEYANRQRRFGRSSEAHMTQQENKSQNLESFPMPRGGQC